MSEAGAPQLKPDDEAGCLGYRDMVSPALRE
jgi:hypothetical protein